jgi:hypothetical protein
MTNLDSVREYQLARIAGHRSWLDFLERKAREGYAQAYWSLDKIDDVRQRDQHFWDALKRNGGAA